MTEDTTNSDWLKHIHQHANAGGTLSPSNTFSLIAEIEALQHDLLEATSKLEEVHWIIDDVLFNDSEWPRNEYGFWLGDNKHYLNNNIPIMNEFLPALRQWFVDNVSYIGDLEDKNK